MKFDVKRLVVLIFFCGLFLCVCSRSLPAADGLLCPAEIRENIYASTMVSESDYVMVGDRGWGCQGGVEGAGRRFDHVGLDK